MVLSIPSSSQWKVVFLNVWNVKNWGISAGIARQKNVSATTTWQMSMWQPLVPTRISIQPRQTTHRPNPKRSDRLVLLGCNTFRVPHVHKSPKVTFNDWIGLDLFNDDTRPSGHISRPTQVNVSQNCFHSLNNYSSPIILSSLGASWS